MGRVPATRGRGADDVRPDDRRLLDLHRQPGDRAGHVRVLRGDRAPSPRRVAGGHDLADRRARWDGRRAAARGDAQWRRHAVRRDRPRGDRAAVATRATWTSSPTRSTTLSSARSTAKRERRAVSIGVHANAADVLPELLRRGFEADIVTDQTSAHDPLSGYVPNTMTFEEAASLRVSDPDEYVHRSRRAMAAHCAAMVGFKDAGSEVFDYGNSLRAEALLGGFERAFDYPGFVPGVRAATVLRGPGPVSVGRAVGRPGRHRRNGSRGARGVPRRRAPGSMDRRRGRADRVPGAARADLLARVRRARAARAAIQQDGRLRRAEGADRDRPRPPRLRLGRLPVPRDRVDGRRLGCDRGLAAAERARQHLRGRVVGVDPSRRRRRHRALDPRRDGRASPTAPRWLRRSSSGC